MKIPLIGLGTWLLKGKECTNIVKEALEIGYRHIDTAHVYENHESIKEAIQGFDREKLFITTKLSLMQIDFKAVKKSVEKACDLARRELGIDYIDLYLIHWPDHLQPQHLVFQEMQRLRQKQKVGLVGVSNFNMHHLQDFAALGLYPSVNQIEFHPYLYQQEMFRFCRNHHIRVMAYRPFGKGALLKDDILSAIGKKYNKSISQVILRWLIQKDIPAIPKASSRQHLKDNLDVFDFSLDKDDVAKVDGLNKNQRFCKPDNEEHIY